MHTKSALFAAIAQQHNAAVQMADDECGNALACLQVCSAASSVTVKHDYCIECYSHASRRSCRGEADLSGAGPMLHPDSNVVSMATEAFVGLVQACPLYVHARPEPNSWLLGSGFARLCDWQKWARITVSSWTIDT